jgi:hypothetical protein
LQITEAIRRAYEIIGEDDPAYKRLAYNLGVATAPIFRLPIADDLDETDEEQLNLVFQGAYPTLEGDNAEDGYLLLWRGAGRDETEAVKELEYVASFNAHGACFRKP